MATMDVTVRLQALNGTWETCGADRMIGVLPETETHTHNEWGPDKASFTLKRPVFAIWPDLGAFTPVEIEIGGVIVWEGRISETPVKAGTEQQISVQCEGWQYHLDDDVFLRCYVHSKLTDWKDTRSFLEADLTRWVAAPQVGSQQGAVTIGWANGTPVVTNNMVGVTLDLGPACTAKRVVLQHEVPAVDATILLYVRGSNSLANAAAEGIDAISALTLNGSSGTHAGTFSEPVRYITVLLFYTGAGGTFGSDQIAKLKKLLVFGETGYESGNESVLLASTIVKDALERGTLLLSSDYSQVDPTSFHIPDFMVAPARTPRELIEAANAYHNWVAKLTQNRRVAYEARPSHPVLESGAWSQDDTEDNSANSGAEIYNRALVEATGPEGTPLVVERAASQQPTAVPVSPVSPAPDNPSFNTNTEHWTATVGAPTISRDTTTFDTSPASGKFEAAATMGVKGTFTGTFKKGTQYVLSFAIKGTSTTSLILIEWGATQGVQIEPPVPNAWTTFTLAWTPSKDTTGVLFQFLTAKGTLWVDSLALHVVEPTLVDRRNFQRTKTIQMSPAITEAEGNQIGDIFLQAHMSTPFKGSETVRHGAIRRVLGGQPVHPSQLGLYTQQLIRLSNLIDPDTGGVGRDGTIAEVQYSHKDQSAAVTLDDKRGNFEALLNRLAVVQTPGS